MNPSAENQTQQNNAVINKALCDYFDDTPAIPIRDINGDEMFKDRVPDYCRDLNAMHRIEQMLQGRDNWNKYVENIWYGANVPSCIKPWDSAQLFANIVVSTTALQRARAMVKTLRLDLT